MSCAITNRPTAAIVAGAALLFGAALAGFSASPLTPGERAGRDIYLRGVGAEAITAALSEGEISTAASSVPCAGCHGDDGSGRPEAGIAPSNITWEALTKPYGVKHEGGRQHPPYDERSLERAIVEGVDPMGNSLLPAMPRYRMGGADMANLIAYLKRLGTYHDPGLSDTSLRLGTIIPTAGPARAAGLAFVTVLEAYFEEINAGGGIYGRKLELRVMDDTTSSAMLSQIEGDVFALISPLAADTAALAKSAEERELPLVAPLTQITPEAEQRYTFYLAAGANDQVLVLGDFLARNLTAAKSVAIVHANNDGFAEVAKRVRARLEKAGRRAVIIACDRGAEQVADELSRKGIDAAVLLIGDEGQAALARAAAGRGWRGTVLLPAALTSRETLAVLSPIASDVYESFPFLPSDQTAAGREAIDALVATHHVRITHATFQVWALAAAQVMTEALRLSGRQLSRQRLVASLESLYQFETGLVPAITFGPHRRIGVLGAYVVRLDRERQRFVPVTQWISAY